MLTLYCNCILNKTANHSQYLQKNLVCGSSSLTENQKNNFINKGYFFDDSGDNISALNKYLGDLTGLYYVWKNTNHEFVGTNQYRRFWNESEILRAGLYPDVLYISTPTYFDISTASQYEFAHGPAGLNILIKAAKSNKIDISVDLVNKLNHINFVSTCNMFFAHKTIFDKVCQILFPIIFELYEGSKYCLDFVQPNNQTRLIAYLSERILTLLYIEKDYYFGKDLKIQPISWIYK